MPLVFRNLLTNPNDICSQAREQVEEFRQAHVESMLSGGPTQPVITWFPPSHGIVNIKYRWSFQGESGFRGTGTTIRDHLGRFLGAFK